MNRLLRSIFLVLAVLLLLHAVSFAYYLHVYIGGASRSRIIWLELCGAVFLVVAGLRFSLGAKFKIFALMLVLLFVELLLQATAWLGILPLVSTKINAPYSRVYWTSEGKGNSIRNRYGWYYPPFDLKAAHRILYIGDSQVEAVEVLPTRNSAADLQVLLKARSPDWAVLCMGSHGTCPAFSIEVLKYAARHFHPQEAIVAVTMGSDISDASPILNVVPISSYIYYDLDADGNLVLNPGSAGMRDRFDRMMELNTRSIAFNLPMILYSHCMLIQFMDSVRDHFVLHQRQAELAARATVVHGKEAEQMALMGFNPLPFAVDPNPECRRAMAVLLAQLRECKAVCDTNGMTLRIVTIPTFPKVFYDSQHGRDWTMHIGDYDYFKPEREVADWARSNAVPVLALGGYIQEHKLDVREIHDMYFSDGMGHFDEKGHRSCAEAMFETFYQSAKP